MAYLQPQMDRQVQRAESSLTNRGLPLGSSAWNSAMENIYDTQNRTLSSLSNEALLQGQQYQSNILGQAGMAGGQVIDPSMVAGQAGAGLSDTYDKLYNSQVEAWKQEQASKNALTSGLLGAVGKIGGAAIGTLIAPGVGTAAGAAAGDALTK